MVQVYQSAAKNPLAFDESKWLIVQLCRYVSIPQAPEWIVLLDVLLVTNLIFREYTTTTDILICKSRSVTLCFYFLLRAIYIIFLIRSVLSL